MKTTHRADLSAIPDESRPFWAFLYGVEVVPLCLGESGALYIHEEALPLGPRACLAGYKLAAGLDLGEPVQFWADVIDSRVVVRPALGLGVAA